MSCHEAEHLSAYLNGDLEERRRSSFEAHLDRCAICSTHWHELQTLALALRTRRAPLPPPDLLERLHERLASEPIRPRMNFYWPGVLTGAIAAGVLFVGTWIYRNHQTSLPVLQTAAVSVATPVSVQIGFDVQADVEDVTYTIDLPKGLEFVDDHDQPIAAQSISWKGSLRRGKTVVPITVCGIRPGRYEILATIRKDQAAQTTKIVLPVQDKPSQAPVDEPQNTKEIPWYSL